MGREGRRRRGGRLLPGLNPGSCPPGRAPACRRAGGRVGVTHTSRSKFVLQLSLVDSGSDAWSAMWVLLTSLAPCSPVLGHLNHPDWPRSASCAGTAAAMSHLHQAAHTGCFPPGTCLLLQQTFLRTPVLSAGVGVGRQFACVPP